MTSLYAWAEQYINTLPPAIRPTVEDSRFITAARRAQGNQWGPERAAQAVAARGYDNASNPVLLAIIRLEQLADTAPFTRPTKTPPCRCGEPHQPIPAQWLAQRWALLRDLTRTPGMTEDAREQAMTRLIQDQKGELDG